MANPRGNVSFSFTKFVPGQQDMILQGDAVITSTGSLQLTKAVDGQALPNSVGRVLYSTPIRIRDRDTGNVANFKSTFSFLIGVPIKATAAEGLAFFLAPVDTQPQQPGGLLGLFPDARHSNSFKTVAVEFDTSRNSWDPDGAHIGIDVNSIVSTRTTPCELARGELANVEITYSSKTLTATLVFPSSPVRYTVSDSVDFNLLPEYVRVGFSAATGIREGLGETHDVLSWSFQSELP